MDIKKVKNNAVQQIIDTFTQQLISGTLRPGDQIPTEVELSVRFGVSRNTVREAVKILVAMGVLEIRRPVGTYVCDSFTDAMINPILYGVILSRGENYDELMDLREIMETGTMLTVIRNASDDQIASLEEPLHALKDACLCASPSIEEVFQKDNAFHEIVMSLSHNRVVYKIAEAVRAMTHDMRLESVQLMLQSGRAQEFYEAHEKIYRVLVNRDVTGVYTEIRSTYFIPNKASDTIVNPAENLDNDES